MFEPIQTFRPGETKFTDFRQASICGKSQHEYILLPTVNSNELYISGVWGFLFGILPYFYNFDVFLPG